MSNIHPDFEIFVSRKQKEQFLNQKSCVIWFTGLSGSGKSTIAAGLDKKLNALGFYTMVLDGDNVRTGINSNLGFSIDDRNENIRRIAEVAKLFANNGVICICCFVSPLLEQRAMAKSIIGENDFIEVFVNTPIEECEKRDVKGLYEKARMGLIKDFTGISSPFEAPVNANIEIKTIGKTVAQNVEEVFSSIKNKICK